MAGHALQPKSWTSAGHRHRDERIGGYLRGRRALDLGCVSGEKKGLWLHAELASVASVVGLDLNAAKVQRANEKWGTDVRVGDAQSFDLGETFDVIHAGELIEHLDNPGGMLSSAAKHLEPGGLLVLTTPNPFAFSNFVYRIGGKPKVNREHTCWFCEDTIRSLLGRFDFEVVEVDYLPHDTPGRVRAFVARAVRVVLPRRLKWNTLLVVARLSR